MGRVQYFTARSPIAFRRWLWSYVRQYRSKIALLSLVSLGSVGFELLEPWPLKILIDSVFGTVAAPLGLAHLSKPHLLLAVALGFILIYGLESIISLGQTMYLHRLMFRFDRRLMAELFDKIQNFPLRHLDDKQAGDYAYRLNAETGDVSQLILDVTNKLLTSGCMVLGILCIMVRIDWLLALISLAAVPSLYLSIRRFAPRIERQSLAVERSNSALYGHTTEAIQNVRLTQAFNDQPRQLNVLERLLKRNFVYQLRYLLTSETFSLTNDVIATAAMAVLVALGAERVFAHGLSVGYLLIFLTYVSYLYGPLQSISDSLSEARGYFAAAKRVFELYNYQHPLPLAAHPRRLKRAQGRIEFRHVSSAYGKHGVLHNVSLVIEPGEKVGIIGRSGEGKTTLLNLLPRFYDYCKGDVLLDGVPLTELDLTSLRNQFAVLSQQAPLFNTSVLENLKLARRKPQPSLRQITKAARDANAYDFIHQLPKGFRTVVGENSSLLSGGQRQRIAIARAFLKDAPILLLDEPSTGLDEQSTSIILDALRRLMANRTTIIVSHSLAMLRDTDAVYVLDKGRILTKTTYQQLIEAYQYSHGSIPKELAIFREAMFDHPSSDTQSNKNRPA